MSNCSNNRKDLFGQNDMQHVAEDIGNLHYQTFSHLLKHLSKKLKQDSRKDWAAGRIQIANRLKTASDDIKKAFVSINEAWEISKPFMEAEINNVQPKNDIQCGVGKNNNKK
jgi:hypothetical protein